MPIATGINKKVAYAKETTWGVAAAAGTGAYVRRVTSNFNLQKETYQSDEIRTDYQIVDFRHGVRTVDGTINGELSAGAYQEFFAAALAKDFAAGASASSQDITIASNVITRAAGDFLADGFKVGEIIRLTGCANSQNDNKNLLVLVATASSLTVIPLNGVDLVDETNTLAVDVNVAGKKSFTPETGHTDDSFTIEEYYEDIDQSEVFVGNKVNSVGVSLPATGMSTIDISFMGKDLDAANTGAGQYFTTPTSLPCDGLFAAVNGALIVEGAVVALVTGVNFTINRNMSAEAVVGSNVYPDIYEGRVMIDGELTVLFEDGVFRDYFVNESAITLAVALTASDAADADAMAFVFPRIKINSADKNDGENGITSTHSFQALMDCDAGAGFDTEATTLVVQDTTLV